MTKVVLRHMVERKAGHIVVVSSVQGKFGRLRVNLLYSKLGQLSFFSV